ncbi:glutathione peroxidase [Rhodobaculum claviforme]|uniref:Glutathione peroxidase n=1 Tax=Rhodobaculum claviforme TaxID=1549854 RepID=A0A934TIG2_9RHOB|nr:glutathione peroxidase [Rhodobaculum claviforme]MBK5926243.1 glutathione peroxidase [Rhodobaculum claviforme]
MHRRVFALAALAGTVALGATLGGARAQAASGDRLPQGLTLRGITGETLALDDWRGRPVLVVNTASRCGFTRQYDEMQALYERFADRGLVVLAVPSNDFNQELADDAAVAEFCEVNFGLTFPMAGITPVRGAQAHPLYAWLARAHGFAPRWNFNKVLIGADGSVRGTWGSMATPTGRAIVQAVEGALAGA